jgi:nitronate monooxygenase
MKGLKIGDLEVKFPIVQGGMGVGISLSRLAAAVANEGGIGIISASAIGMLEPDYMRNYRQASLRALHREITKAKSLTKGVIGVNIMMALTDHEELIKTSIDAQADIIILGAGLPLKIPAMLADSGYHNIHTKLAVKVSSAKAARLIFQFWADRYNIIPDAVVVEGPMAGGHLGFKKSELQGILAPLPQLIRETVEAVHPFEHQFSKDVPVIAAGGIYNGTDMFAIMQAGAKGVKLGTRFVTTHECDASIEFKQTYLDCNSEDIMLIDSPVGLPGRVINNDFVEQIKQGNSKPFKCIWHCLIPCDFKKAPYCIAQALFNAARGNMNEGFAFSGTNGYRATEIQSVSEVFTELIEEYEEASLKNLLLTKECQYELKY